MSQEKQRLKDKQRLNLPEIKPANQVISKDESVKFIGIYIDEKLNGTLT